MNTKFTGKRVLIMGLGVHGGGVGAAKFFVEQGARVSVTDIKTESTLASSLTILGKLPIRFVLGKHDSADFVNSDLILRSPDVPVSSPFLQIARRHGVPIEMETSLFLKILGRRDIIGITGTRGKTTTTMMTAAIAQQAGKHVLVGGNVRGVSTLSLLPQVRKDSMIIFELSSWQLQGFVESRISPQYAVITNIYPDHLNRYRSMDEYVSDKKGIFQFQQTNDHLFLNRRSPYTQVFAREAHGHVHLFDALDCAGMPLQVSGEHNFANAAASCAVSRVLGMRNSVMYKALKRFAPLAYRQQPIATIKGVHFMNDTTSTTPEATEAALRVVKGPIILIAGGADKGLAYGNLGNLIDEKVKNVVLLDGTGTDKLAAAIKRKEKILARSDNFAEAVACAYKASAEGDTVLLSPGFASFGMFQNEFDRGDQFNALVAKLAT